MLAKVSVREPKALNCNPIRIRLAMGECLFADFQSLAIVNADTEPSRSVAPVRVNRLVWPGAGGRQAGASRPGPSGQCALGDWGLPGTPALDFLKSLRVRYNRALLVRWGRIA